MASAEVRNELAAEPPRASVPGAAREDDPIARDAELGRQLLSGAVPRSELAAAVHDRFAEDVHRLVWRLLGADSEHADIVQQVFVRVLGRAHTLREPDKLRPWIHAIAVNTVYAELRRRRLRRLFGVRSSSFPEHSDLVREVEARDFVLRARALIERMPPPERIVFVLHYAEERPLHEVAELCGFSLATARRRLAAADRRFRVLIGRNPELLALLDRGRAE